MPIDPAKLKKILMVVLFVFVAIIIAILLYFVFFREGPPPVENMNMENVGPGNINLAPNGNIALVNGLFNGINLPVNVPIAEVSDVATGGVTKVDEIPDAYSKGSTMGKDGSLYYYDYLKEKFYKITPDGKLVPLTDKLFYDVSDVTWSPGNDKAILEYPDQRKIMYDFNSGKQVTLPAHWENFSFSPSGEEIAFKSIGLEPENRWLVISNPDGSRADIVTLLNADNDTVKVNWSPAQLS